MPNSKDAFTPPRLKASVCSAGTEIYITPYWLKGGQLSFKTF